MAVRGRSRRFRPSGEGLEGRRLLADGVLDAAFGAGGLATTAFPISNGGTDFATSTAVQADGKVIVAGYVQVGNSGSNYDFGVARYNTDEQAMRDFLATSGAKPITVPYRANRAVIFDSDLLHETDRFRFRPGYENRRINITYLYGWRARGTRV